MEAMYNSANTRMYPQYAAQYADNTQQQQQQQQHHQQQIKAHASMAGGRPKPPQTKAQKRKRAKDPNRPKRPTSAYFYFVAAERVLCEKRGEKVTKVAEWTKEISVKWRAFTPEEKQVFDVKAKADKIRYDTEMAKYKGKDANRPKRPMSAYFLWLQDFRLRMKTKITENKELLRAAGENWKRLTDVEKVPYEKQAEVRRKDYEMAMRDYSQGIKRPKLEAPVVAAAPVVEAKNGAAAADDDDDDDDDDEEDDDDDEEDDE